LYEISLSREGETCFTAFCQAIEPRLRGDLLEICDWAGKLPGAVARIAAILHIASGAGGGISVNTVECAIKIGEYLLAHARAALGGVEANEDVQHAELVLNWLKSHGGRAKKRDLYRGLAGKFTRAKDLEAPLALLQERALSSSLKRRAPVVARQHTSARQCQA
jgi:hypothetical protein